MSDSTLVSVTGRYYQPPDIVPPVLKKPEVPGPTQARTYMNVGTSSSLRFQNKPDIDSQELQVKLQSAEDRCHRLKKHLDSVNKMIESVKKGRHVVFEEQETSKPQQSAPLKELLCKKIPFVVGTSTGPSYSVYANLQSVLHMMKHHHPQLCNQKREQQRAGSGAKRSMKKSFSPDSRSELPAEYLSMISDLLLLLQDELGIMSFEQMDLMQRLDAAKQPEHRLDLQRLLENVDARIEEKAAQIIQVRQHQQAVQRLTTDIRHTDEAAMIRPPTPTPVIVTPQTKRHRRLKGTQKTRNYLKEKDCRWE
ncbi:centrosomal protein cep57l1-like [Thalassophryne amazonica]|uniref:centrosomal protein cep57l1-like n=1 Tax=Thalassophryne amazonica TaxID=390379 RepID=UPI001472609F|nr:centrosomal protein cep57l1-like [Thalassophryne amazonica]